MTSPTPLRAGCWSSSPSRSRSVATSIRPTSGGGAAPADVWGRRGVRKESGEPPADRRLAQAWELIASPGVTATHRALAKQAADIVLPTLVRQEILSSTPRPLLGPRYSLLDET